MNYSTAVMLINDNIKAVKVSYDVDHNGDGEDIKTFKTLDATLVKGDLVIVPTNTRHNFTVVRVEEIEVEIDFEATTKINWIAGKISTDEHKAILSEEGQWIKAIKASEERKKRKQIEENLREAHDDVDFNSLAITNMSGNDAVIEDNTTD